MRDHARSTARLLSLLGAGVLLSGCTPKEILSRTEVRGTVNGSALQGQVTATIYLNRGGTSTCEFARLPTGFNPGTFGTHA